MADFDSNLFSGHHPVTPGIRRIERQSQLDFEVEFYQTILGKLPDYIEVLQIQAGHYAKKGLLREGLKVDQSLIKLRPENPTFHYNLACRYALLKQSDMALHTLRRALELGYDDVIFMARDKDLSSLVSDPRFFDLLQEFGHL